MFKMLLRVPLNLYKYKGSFRRLIAAISDLQMLKMGLRVFRTATSLNEQLFLFMFFLFNLTASIDQQNRQKIAKSDWQPSCQCSSPNKYHNGGKSTLSRPTNVKRFTIKLVYRRNWSLVSEG